VTLRFRAWLDRWGPILPLLIAEGTIWLGFGALLPILPIYFTRHGVDLPTLGIVVAAWPAARLLGEPFFGWVADRSSRKAMMVVGLVLAAGVAVLPLFVVGPIAFITFRALAGLCASIYDPAARGYLVDANPPERQGETFGLYSAAQMGGFMIGPAVGGIAAAVTGEPTVVFWVFGLAYAVSALVVLVRVADLSHDEAKQASESRHGSAGEVVTAAADSVAAAASAEDAVPADDADEPHPTRLLNRLLLVALVVNVGAYLAGGTYEVIWSVYMNSLGANIALIGVSFFTFSLPVIILAPFAGRFIDRRGGYVVLVLGGIGVAVCGLLYPLVPSPWWMVGLGLVEGTAAAVSSPALYTLVSRAAPSGKSSTAQGLFGAAGTSGTIVASLATGYLAAIDLRLPFIVMGVTSLTILLISVAVGGRTLYAALQPHHARAHQEIGA